MNLSAQDRNVLQLIVEGKSNHQIGNELGIRHEAVRFHTRRLFESYGVQTRSELLHQLVHQYRRQPPTFDAMERHDQPRKTLDF